MSFIRIGLIGCGKMGQNHLKHLWSMAGKGNSEVLPTVLIDKKHALLQSLAWQYPPVITFTDYTAPSILQHIDAVIIAADPASHCKIASYFLENGKDVFVEKPMALDVVCGEDLVKLSENNGCVLQVGHIERFNPVTKKIKSIGTGDLRYIEFKRTSDTMGRTFNIDVVKDLMIHDIDILISLTNARRIGIMPLRSDAYLRQHASVCIVLETGALARFSVYRFEDKFDAEPKRKVHAVYSNVSIWGDFKEKMINIGRYTAPLYPHYIEELDLNDDSDQILLELEDFVNCIKNRKKPIVSGVDGLRALTMACTIVDILNGTRYQELLGE